MIFKHNKINQGNFIPTGPDQVERYNTPAKFFNDLSDDVRSLVTNFEVVVNPSGDIIANLVLNSQGAPTAKTTSITLTAAEILTEIITGTHAAGATQTYTLPTGTLLETALAGRMAINQSFSFYLINLSSAAADTITLGAGSGFTIVGNAITANLSSSHWKVRKTATNTFIAYRI